MTLRSLANASLVAALALALPAQAQQQQQAPPRALGEVPAGRVRHRELREVLFEALRAASGFVPALRSAVPRTTGEHKVAVVLVELQDEKGAFPPAEFARALFSKGGYARTASGDPAFGSLRDYFLENSSGRLDVTGRVFDWVGLAARRADLEARPLFDPGARRRLFQGALDALLAREGARALEGFDSLAFVVAGDSAKKRGGLLWPHSTALVHAGRVWRYYLMHAGRRFQPINIHCHEFGHVLGISDKYGTGAGTGLGQWCLMASGGHGPRTRGLPLDAPDVDFLAKLRGALEEQWKELRDLLPGPRAPAAAAGSPIGPLHLCAVCKDRLGWSRARVLDPTRRARFYLDPVEADARQVARVLLDPRGRETLYLEHRARRGFDGGLPAEGLYLWRVGSPTAFFRTFVPLERVELVPAHGSRSIDAPHRAPERVAFRSGSVEVAGTLPGSYRVRISEVQLEGGRLSLVVERVRTGSR